jgi:hypothetical protein
MEEGIYPEILMTTVVLDHGLPIRYQASVYWS